MYEIEFQPHALNDLKSLRKFQQQQVLDSIEMQLRQRPTVATRNRKRLRPNETAEWELRVGQLRVFYNTDEDPLVVRIEAIGLKVGNLLFIREKRRNYEDNSRLCARQGSQRLAS
jgi:mRNA-degrading endonuclease RelE of RelBE toxin-antitoxin system